MAKRTNKLSKMNNRNQRRNIGENTLEILKQNHYTNELGELVDLTKIQQRAIANTKLYPPALSDELCAKRPTSATKYKTTFHVVKETTLNSVRNLVDLGLSNVVYLNFASAKNPGGGFLGGSQAQEESIARATGLYPCLLSAFEYYDVNRNFASCFYTDHMIYSPNVPIIKNEEGLTLKEPVLASVITAPAVNSGVVRKKEPERANEIELVMKRRMEKVLAIAIENGHKDMVLGAWGCGVFRNDPLDVARWFKETIVEKFTNEFENIVFAIYAREDRFINPFYDHFLT